MKHETIILYLVILSASLTVALWTPFQDTITHNARCSTMKWSRSSSFRLFVAKNTNSDGGDAAWFCLGEIATISSPWVSIHCERLQDNNGQVVDYWRVEKAASCIVLTITADGRFVLPKAQYRPGAGKATLDFCGGRCNATNPQDAVATILHRELGVDLERDVASLRPLNAKGFIINSSFSNQLLFGYVAHLKADLKLDSNLLHSVRYESDKELLHGADQLECLQCRSLLMEWMLTRRT